MLGWERQTAIDRLVAEIDAYMATERAHPITPHYAQRRQAEQLWDALLGVLRLAADDLKESRAER